MGPGMTNEERLAEMRVVRVPFVRLLTSHCEGSCCVQALELERRIILIADAADLPLAGCHEPECGCIWTALLESPPGPKSQ